MHLVLLLLKMRHEVKVKKCPLDEVCLASLDVDKISAPTSSKEEKILLIFTSERLVT